MPDVVLLDKAVQDLKGLLAQMSLGESVTLADTEGKPLALLVSLQAESTSPPDDADWWQDWETMAREISASWQGEQSALETLAEMRR